MNPYLKKIFRTLELVLRHPERFWTSVFPVLPDRNRMFRQFIPKLAGIAGLTAFLAGLADNSLPSSAAEGAISLATTWTGSWIAFWIIREYLYGKTEDAEKTALALVLYSAPVFFLLHSAGTALENFFIGQLLLLSSYSFILPLHSGIRSAASLDEGQRSNLLVIAILALICIPVIISRLIMIAFSMPAIHI